LYSHNAGSFKIFRRSPVEVAGVDGVTAESCDRRLVGSGEVVVWVDTTSVSTGATRVDCCTLVSGDFVLPDPALDGENADALCAANRTTDSAATENLTILRYVG